MLYELDRIIAANRAFVEMAEVSDHLNMAALAIDVLKAYADLHDLNRDDDITVRRLSIRIINAAGACGLCALGGFYQPATAQIRDIIEVSFLLDLFVRKPHDIARWRKAETKQEREYFKMINVRKTLDKLDGTEERFREEAYKFYSTHGTHADPWAVQLISHDMQTVVGPFPDETRIRGISFDLAKFTSLAANLALRAIDEDRILNDTTRQEVRQTAALFFEHLNHWRGKNILKTK